VQFFNDDLSELYGNYNAPAAEVFKKVLVMTYGVCRYWPARIRRLTWHLPWHCRSL